jgi:hypothetical protein
MKKTLQHNLLQVTHQKPNVILLHHIAIFKFFYFSLFLLSFNIANAQCWGDDGNACGGGGSTLLATIDPTNLNDTWDSKSWNYTSFGASGVGSNWPNLNRYVEFTCPTS